MGMTNESASRISRAIVLGLVGALAGMILLGPLAEAFNPNADTARLIIGAVAIGILVVLAGASLLRSD